MEDDISGSPAGGPPSMYLIKKHKQISPVDVLLEEETNDL